MAGAGSDPAKTPVNYENLWYHDAFWPYHVELTESWKPMGFEGEQFAWGTGSLGVLVRVERSGALRVDFGRFGRHSVPARATNVVAETEKIRRGEKTKASPNFVLAVVNKLVDPTTDPVGYVAPTDVRAVAAYLIVAADPAAEGFAALASSLGPLGERADVMPVLFPQGEHSDDEVLELCKQAGWTGPFAHSRFRVAYTESILGKGLELPSVILQSPDGREMASGVWTDETAAQLAQAIERELGAVVAEPLAQRVP